MDPTDVTPDSAPSAVTPAFEPMTVMEIQEFLPHRYPFLLLDRIIEFEPRRRIVAIKNVTINEPFFAGHFPGHPIMPGVLVLEAMAQAGALMILKEDPDRQRKLIFFTGVDNAKFRHPVTPGDQLRLEIEVLRFRLSTGRMQGRALIDGKLAAEATLSCHVVPRGDETGPRNG